MWSQCTCEKNRCAVIGICLRSFSPRPRRPVPPSKITSCSATRSSTQLRSDGVPVHVREEQMRGDRHLLEKLLAETAQTGAAVEDHELLRDAKLDAARIAANLDRCRPRRGDAAS